MVLFHTTLRQLTDQLAFGIDSDLQLKVISFKSTNMKFEYVICIVIINTIVYSSVIELQILSHIQALNMALCGVRFPQSSQFGVRTSKKYGA